MSCARRDNRTEQLRIQPTTITIDEFMTDCTFLATHHQHINKKIQILLHPTNSLAGCLCSPVGGMVNIRNRPAAPHHNPVQT